MGTLTQVGRNEFPEALPEDLDETILDLEDEALQIEKPSEFLLTQGEMDEKLREKYQNEELTEEEFESLHTEMDNKYNA